MEEGKEMYKVYKLDVYDKGSFMGLSLEKHILHAQAKATGIIKSLTASFETLKGKH